MDANSLKGWRLANNHKCWHNSFAMETIKEMIDRLCPNGVSFMSLGEAQDKKLLSMGRGQIISKDAIRDNPGKYPVYSSSTKNNGEIGRYGLYMFEDERITWSIDGGGDLFYRNNERYSVTNVCGWMKVEDQAFINTRFLYYSLFEQWTKQTFDYTHKAHPSVIRDIYVIPILPIEVQKEIVRILDTFTELQAGLEAELAARQKQYEYYRNKLLSFDEDDNSVEWKTLGEIGKMLKGKGIQKSDFVDVGKPCIHYGQVHTYYGFSATKTKSFISEEMYASSNKAQNGDLIIATTSEDVEACCKSTVWLGEEEVAISGDAHYFRHNQNPKYMGYLFMSEMFAKQKRRVAVGAKVTRVHGDSMEKFKFPFPSPDRQRAIVDQLDTFEELISSLKREIELRKKQYEYYREQLLTFE